MAITIFFFFLLLPCVSYFSHSFSDKGILENLKASPLLYGIIYLFVQLFIFHFLLGVQDSLHKDHAAQNHCYEIDCDINCLK